MCLEVYCPGQGITIPFENEEIEFLDAQTIQGTYTLLIHNSSDKQISQLCWLYPRQLFGDPQELESASSTQIEDITTQIQTVLPYPSKLTERGELQFFVPDPNSPEKNIDKLSGRWSNSVALHSLTAPIDEKGNSIYEARHNFLMNYYGFTCLILRLTKPLESGESQWFGWRIISEMVGEDVKQSVMGPHIFHRFASPIFVHRAVRETFVAGVTDFDIYDDAQVEQLPIHQSMIDAFNLTMERKVDLQLHFLTLWPGDPLHVALQDWQVYGDLRMLSGSPEIVTNGHSETVPVFKWKSGTAIEPAHPWKEEGFMLRIVLRYDPNYRFNRE